jgi:hypothetical protein
LVEDRSIPILGELAHLQLEVVHHTFRLQTLALQRSSGLLNGGDAGVLALFELGDERGLAKLRIHDAAF